ncbi:hypothetical protein ACLOJK_002774 [Asimina triloba]
MALAAIDVQGSKSFPKWLLHPLQTTTTHSFQILSKTPLLFLSITAFSILPSALLLFSLAFSSRPLERQISYKTRVADASYIPVEVQHIYHEARSDALSLLRLKALYFLPSFLFSLLAALTAVASAALAHNGKRPSHAAALATARKAWPRFASTSAFAFVAASGCGYFARGLWGLRWLGWARPAVGGAGVVLEVYAKEVVSLGMVASVVEERWGVEALVTGWEVMEGRRVCGALLGGLLVLESCGIGWGLRALMDGGEKRMQLMEGVVGMVCLVGLFCGVVLWSFVSNTVFYLECKKFRASETDSRSLELVSDAL